MAKGVWPTDTYPFGCPHYGRALDQYIAQVYWGYDLVNDWPYQKIVPKGSEPKECDYCKGSTPIRKGFPFE